ncbi:MAG: rod-binding protein [Treponema sp.]|jgi:flagellar protein FlgJ|nr:rod-binding protein [Treponema sp.]
MEIAGSINPASMQMDNIRMTSAPAIHSPQNFSEMLKRASSSGNAETRPKSAPIDKEDKLYKLCLDLETFLVKNLLTGMRNTVQKSGLINEGFAGKMYEDMLYDEYAKDFTKNAGFGLAEQAYRQLTSRY